MNRSLGLVVNPVAGIGGPAALKGSDGRETQRLALARGAVPRAGQRAADALRLVARAVPDAVILTIGGAMGEQAVRAAGLTPRQVLPDPGSATDATDTIAAVRALVDAGAGLVLFVGGDGTARDVADGLMLAVGNDADSDRKEPIDRDTPDHNGPIGVVGVPAGVKMHSGCFAVSPAAAGATAVDFLSGRAIDLLPREVLDLDEDAVRAGVVMARLYGVVPVPVVRGRTQSGKQGTPVAEATAVAQAAGALAAAMEPGVRYLLGPGGTVGEVARRLGVGSTPLGVDVVEDGRLVCADADEATLLRHVAGHRVRVVLTVVGGQGFLLGRGNQQLSARVLRAVGRSPLLVVATEAKLTALGGRPLLVDTGDPDLDDELSGHLPVVTGPGSRSLYPVQPAERQGVPQCV